MKKYIVSACLAGNKCRYDASSKDDDEVIKFVNEGRAICVCPEVLGGLSVPRQACEIKNGRVITKSGEDVTDNFVKGALETLKISKDNNIKTAILKDKSPSCGIHTYDGSFTGKLTNEMGVTAKLLKKNNIKIISK